MKHSVSYCTAWVTCDDCAARRVGFGCRFVQQPSTMKSSVRVALTSEFYVTHRSLIQLGGRRLHAAASQW